MHTIAPDLSVLANSDIEDAVELLAKRAIFGAPRFKQAAIEDYIPQPLINAGNSLKQHIGSATASEGLNQLGGHLQNAWDNNPALRGGVYGAGIGGLLGLGSSLLGKKKRPISDALTGAALGGLAGGVGGHFFLQPSPESLSAKDTADKALQGTKNVQPAADRLEQDKLPTHPGLPGLVGTGQGLKDIGGALLPGTGVPFSKGVQSVQAMGFPTGIGLPKLTETPREEAPTTFLSDLPSWVPGHEGMRTPIEQQAMGLRGPVKPDHVTNVPAWLGAAGGASAVGGYDAWKTYQAQKTLGQKGGVAGLFGTDAAKGVNSAQQLMAAHAKLNPGTPLTPEKLEQYSRFGVGHELNVPTSELRNVAAQHPVTMNDLAEQHGKLIKQVDSLAAQRDAAFAKMHGLNLPQVQAMPDKVRDDWMRNNINANTGVGKDFAKIDEAWREAKSKSDAIANQLGSVTKMTPESEDWLRYHLGTAKTPNKALAPLVAGLDEKKINWAGHVAPNIAQPHISIPQTPSMTAAAVQKAQQEMQAAGAMPGWKRVLQVGGIPGARGQGQIAPAQLMNTRPGAYIMGAGAGGLVGNMFSRATQYNMHQNNMADFENTSAAALRPLLEFRNSSQWMATDPATQAAIETRIRQLAGR